MRRYNYLNSKLVLINFMYRLIDFAISHPAVCCMILMIIQNKVAEASLLSPTSNDDESSLSRYLRDNVAVKPVLIEVEKDRWSSESMARAKVGFDEGIVVNRAPLDINGNLIEGGVCIEDPAGNGKVICGPRS